ncbi:hypothetical protein F4804DRAFT_330371 [Jackrogersella minutella]|nr:hypothetical protein F4804DRAFT_330371 [Jackrogersella minutella]
MASPTWPCTGAARHRGTVRDAHMYGVLSRLPKLCPGSKAVVWAHLGDVRRREHQPRPAVAAGLPGGGERAGLRDARRDRGRGAGPGRAHAGHGGRTLAARELRACLARCCCSALSAWVVCRPATERSSHYIETVLSEQYGAFLWFDWTKAVDAFETAQPKEALSKGETYPFGV